MMIDNKKELYARRAICRGIIQYLSGIEDPRRFAALDRFSGQLRSIEAKIATLEGAPPPIVIGLKTASLSGVVGKDNNKE